MKNHNDAAFGEIMRSCRDEETLKEAASELGIEPSELAKIERGEVLPSAKTAYELLESYGLRTIEVLDTLLFVEVGWFDIPDPDVEERVFEFFQMSHWKMESLDQAALPEQLTDLGVTDPAVLQRLIAFGCGTPGRWGYLVDGQYWVDTGEPGVPRPRTVTPEPDSATPSRT